MKNSKILIAGSGYLGKNLSTILSKDSDVYCLRRNPEVEHGSSERSIPIKADLTDQNSLSAIPQNLDYLIFTASPDSSTEDSYRKIYIEGLENLLKKLEIESPHLKRFVLISSTATYSENKGNWVYESSETKVNSYNGRILLLSEEILRKSIFNSLIIRASGIYGEKRNSLVSSLARGSVVGDPNSYTNRIHVVDLARAVLHLILEAKDRAKSQTFNVTDCYPATREEVANWVLKKGKELGITKIENLEFQASSNPSTTSHSVSNKRVSNKLLIDSGFSFKFPDFKSGYLPILNSIPRITSK